jgi:conjugative transposon TraN protein
MRRYVVVIVVLIFFVRANAQSADTVRQLAVSNNRTTSVVFPSSIVSIDRGSERIMVQKSSANILRVKADSVFTDTTSLTVITADGKLYAFLVHYQYAPQNLTINLSRYENVSSDTSLVALAKKVLLLKNSLHGIRCSEGGVRLSVLGIYTTGEQIVCKLKVENTSSLSFEIGGLQVYSKDQQMGKRRSSQERLVEPLLSFKPQTVVRQKSSQVVVIILPKPTLNYSKSLRIDLGEKEGERNLSLAVNNRYLINAVLLPLTL